MAMTSKFETILVSSILLIASITSVAQNRIILQHKIKQGKHKILDPDREYAIKTIDATYYSKLVDITDSTVSLIHDVKTGKDTTYYYSLYGKRTDTSVVRPLYRTDTTALLFSDILCIKKDLFKNKRWLLPFVEFGAGAVLAVPLLPVAAIDRGAAGVKEWAGFEAILLGISVPPILISSIKRTYNLKDKWTITTKK